MIEITINPIYPSEYADLARQLHGIDGCSVRSTPAMHYSGSGGETTVAIISLTAAICIPAISRAIEAYYSSRRTLWANMDSKGGGTITSAADVESLQAVLQHDKDTTPAPPPPRIAKQPISPPPEN